MYKKKGLRFWLNIVLSAVFFGLLQQCKKPSFDVQNLNNDRIGAFGHGGMGEKNNFPINSLKSVQEAIDQGANGVEIDVQMTKDFVLVAYHDFVLSNSTNTNGTISLYNWCELSDVTYSSKTLKKHDLVSLSELFTGLNYDKHTLFALDVKSTIEIYTDEFIEQYVTRLVELIKKFDLKDQIIVEFNRVELAKAFHLKEPSIRVFIYNDFEYAFEKAIELGLNGVTCSVDKISSEQIIKAHENNIWVALFGCDSRRKNIEAVELNPDYIQTDELKHLMKIID